MSYSDLAPKSRLSPVLAVVAGCILMLLAAALGVLGMGMGHGWGKPLLVTAFLFPVWPIALWLATRRDGQAGWIDVVIGLVLLAASAALFRLLLLDSFYFQGYPAGPMDPPWFWLAVIFVTVFAGLGWLFVRRHYRAMLPWLMLGIGVMANLGLIWQANYGAGNWHYRGAWPDEAWFWLWGIWQCSIVWTLQQEMSRPEELSDERIEDVFE